jgi:hypothetical protein
MAQVLRAGEGDFDFSAAVLCEGRQCNDEQSK